MRQWPNVIHEFETLDKLLEGYSISRFGDGELKLMTGAAYIRENPNEKLGKEMRAILRTPHPNCLPAIWPLNPNSPKCKSMERHKRRYLPLLSNRVQYYSSLISRPDSAPWIRTREFAEKFARLFAGRRVFAVCEEKSGTLRMLAKAKAAYVEHFECRRHGAYKQIDAMEYAALTFNPDIAILACGPTATCLANRLAGRGIQAIDFGSGGSFIEKLLES